MVIIEPWSYGGAGGHMVIFQLGCDWVTATQDETHAAGGQAARI